jgi:hypothetical protein
MWSNGKGEMGSGMPTSKGRDVLKDIAAQLPACTSLEGCKWKKMRRLNLQPELMMKK